MSVKQEDENNRRSISPNIRDFLSAESNRIYYLNGYKEDLNERELEELMSIVANTINRDRKH